jgi:hypothetical protein
MKKTVLLPLGVASALRRVKTTALQSRDEARPVSITRHSPDTAQSRKMHSACAR